MIGMYAAHTDTFLRVAAVLTATVFSLPLLIAPLAWARVFRWPVDAQADLALYFGRCLGVFATLLSCAAWHAAAQPALQPLLCQFIVLFASAMVLVHIVGAVQKVQPWTETAEIPLWAGFAALGLLFMPPV